MKKLLLVLFNLLFSSYLLQAQTISYTKYVNPFIGTGGHGHTYPGASVPFGMIQVSPDTRLDGWDGCSAYHFTDHKIYGFSHTHLSGTGCSDYGDILLMPVKGRNVFNRESYSSDFKKSEEKAGAGWYKVYLEKPEVAVRLSATTRAGMHEYKFKKGGSHSVTLDLSHRDKTLQTSFTMVSDTEVVGMRRSEAWAKNQYVFFCIRFSKKLAVGSLGENMMKKDAAGNVTVVSLPFDLVDGEILKLKIGISGVDTEGARKNLVSEIPDWNIDQLIRNADEEWNKELSKIEVASPDTNRMTIFYTALYHAFLCPNVYMDVDGRYRGTDLKIHKADNFTNYTVFSLWDTYRALHPLLSVTHQKRTNDFIRTFLAQYQAGGMMPVWELSGNETFCMIGYHSVPVIADAWMKGIRNFDMKLALKAAREYAEKDHLGLREYGTQGYIGFEDDGESVSKTLEYAYDDWCIALMAKAVDDSVAYKKYIQRAQFYKNVFDGSTGFMRGKSAGRWHEPFEATEVNNYFTEGNSWQYTFYVPQDIEGLIKLYGGRDNFEAKLDELFSTKAPLTGRVQPDITGLIGQYAHGNEPSHHIAYLYNYIGRPSKAAERVYLILDQFYKNDPDGLIGNEDCGQMSAWYILSAMGFYPVCPGDMNFAIGTPLFDKVKIHLENGKTFEIEADNLQPGNLYVQSAEMNNNVWNSCYFSYDQLKNGGKLTLKMGNSPTDWGTKQGYFPNTSITDYPIVVAPVADAKSVRFRDKLSVSWSVPDAGANIFYTTDGTQPSTSTTKYTEPVVIDKTTVFRAIACKNGQGCSYIVNSRFFKMDKDKNVRILSELNPMYTAGGPDALIDGMRGDVNYRKGNWQSYLGRDFEAIVDLGSPKKITKVAAGFLNDPGSWIFFPSSVEFYTSEDGRNFTLAGRYDTKGDSKMAQPSMKDFEFPLSVKSQYIKILAKSIKTCPEGHEGSGQPAHIFVDEIIIE